MIDSGLAISTISLIMVKDLGLCTKPNASMHIIRNADGTLNKDGWKEDMVVNMNTGISNGWVHLVVVMTAGDKLLLGADWLNQYGVNINCTTGAVTAKGRTTFMISTEHLCQSQEVEIAR